MVWDPKKLRLGCTQRKKRVHNVNRNESSRGHSLLHGPDMGRTQDRRNVLEQWFGSWRRLAVGGP